MKATTTPDQKAGIVAMLAPVTEGFQDLLTESILKNEGLPIRLDSSKYFLEQRSIERRIDLANELCENYAGLLEIKKTESLLDAIASLPTDVEARKLELKARYIDQKEIKIPGFSADRLELAKLNSFSGKQIEIINRIAEKNSDLSNLKKYWDRDLQKIVFTEDDCHELREKFTHKASDQELEQIMVSHLLVECLNKLNFSDHLPSSIEEVLKIKVMKDPYSKRLFSEFNSDIGVVNEIVV